MATSSGLIYNSGLTNYTGAAPGYLLVDTSTLITLAQADPSSNMLNLLRSTGRTLIITQTVYTEATVNKSYQDAQGLR
jgi:hypothetical protein